MSRTPGHQRVQKGRENLDHTHNRVGKWVVGRALISQRRIMGGISCRWLVGICEVDFLSVLTVLRISFTAESVCSGQTDGMAWFVRWVRAHR